MQNRRMALSALLLLVLLVMLVMLVAALLGGRLLGELDRGLRLLGAGCIAGGVMALAWG